LSSIVAHLPKTFIARREVSTPFEQKGLVMRTLVEQADPGELVLLDGLKTVDAHGWTLVLPDPDAPATRIHAEGRTKVEAEQRVQRAADAIESILTDGADGPRPG
jgi:mannose-1-phosphate guanylyltransferase/phosphomannomutase